MKQNIITNLYCINRTLIAFLAVIVHSPTLRSADIFAITTQGEKVVLRNDGTWFYENKKPEEKHQASYSSGHFFAEDGYGKLTKVIFEHDKEIIALVNEDDLKKIITPSLSLAKEKAKNGLSFVPRKAKIYAVDSKKIVAEMAARTDLLTKKYILDFGKEAAKEINDSLIKVTQETMLKFKNAIGQIEVTFLAKNAYGAEGEEKAFFYFSNDLRLID